ncbi:MAG: hypothetical protein VX541_09445 [Candidatus Poribacteria bacterium]|nr:hypothetical protein [Candidatus Poribacteria bacterium]
MLRQLLCAGEIRKCLSDSRIRRRFHNAYFGSKGTLIVDGMPFKVTQKKPNGGVIGTRRRPDGDTSATIR